MQIKWIELNGFKSFPDKIKIELNSGITCFVGPNGAGKSNIVDAFRWVLGEHNPRMLRGDKMEEVIFQGSASKREKGLAEVSLFLVLNEESNNGESSNRQELEIKRKLYRTGESYFLINGKQARLKDIKEVFVSEGTDIRTYSIIDQHKISEILFKSSQRKALLEECAGISLYKIKKAESEGKLSAAKENLQRIEDILSELEKQYHLLDKQAKRAEKYQKLLTELTELELRTSKTESMALIEELKKLQDELEKLEERSMNLKKAISEVNISKDKYREGITTLEKKIKETEKEVKNKEFEKAKHEKDAALLIQEEKNLKSSIEQINQENLQITTEIEKLKGDLKEGEAIIEKIEDIIKNLQEEIISQEEELIKFQNTLKETEKIIETQRKNLFNLTTEMANKKNLYNNLKKSLDNNQNRIASLQARKIELSEKIKLIEREIEGKELKIEEFEEESKKLQDRIKDMNEKLIAEEREFEDNNRKLIEKKKEEATIAGKIDALVAELWSEEKDGKLLFEYIDVSTEVEELLEVFLDEKLRASVIDDISVIKESDKKGFFFLKNNAKNEVSSAYLEHDLKCLGSMVKIKDPDMAAKFLENTFVVKDIETAVKYQKLLPQAFFITEAGEVLYPDGFIKKGKNINLLKKKRTLEELEKRKIEIQEEIANIEKSIELSKNKKEKLKIEIEKTKTTINNLNNELFRLKESKKNLSKELELITQRLRFMEKEERAINNEIEEHRASIERLKTEIQNLSFSIDETETKIEDLKKSQNEALTEREIKKEILSSKKIELSTLKEKINSKKSEITRINEDIRKLQTKKAKNLEEIERKTKETEKNHLEHREKTNQMKKLEDEIINLNKELESLSNLLFEEKQKNIEVEEKYKSLNEELQSLTSAIGEKKSKENEIKIKLENLWRDINNLYGKDIIQENIEPLEDLALSKIRIKQLKSQLREIGSVDTEILREYEEIKERYEFMLNQQKDIKTSIEELEMAIKKINSLTRKKLRETFELLKEKFNSVFQELFNGGKAEIALTDENNILESELEMNVQVPGKKMSNINLLSGGEKALTAIAFIFACLSIRPSPICILDEVDAPLDDPNTTRLCRIIKNLSNSMQFLVITHNKLMMEAADYIYGVTMQEQGVSSIISLELKEAEVYA
jgi:chromosome segregation protein